jgi:hypothetical protein
MFPVSRREYETFVARERGQTAETLAEIGMVTFPCTDCGDSGCLGWGCVIVPQNGAGEEVLLQIESRGVPRTEIHAFGGGAAV